MSASHYANAPVAVSEVLVEGARVFGYAAPQSGGPCLLRLSANDTPISFAVAAGYSAAAAKEGLRSGWCGFELHGLRSAIALGERVEIACAVSGRILKSMTLDADDMPPAPGATRSLGVEELLAEVRQPRCCPELAQLVPFAVNHLRRHGDQSFRDMAYLTLLGRWPDNAAPRPDSKIAEEEKRVATYLSGITASKEFAEKWGTQLPGPYHPDFRFDTTGLL
ncbi:hypothetical protein [Brevundimonas diminuta]|uniref:hypothetical protein n=1 Tax=Brevundimonas diminuta TaxID=293 RepID=UPI003D07A161